MKKREKQIKYLYLINPRGFCAGVRRAVKTVEKALEMHKKPIYVLHDIVHNKNVVDHFKKRGVVFSRTLKCVPKGGLVIFSAHGVSPAVRKTAEKMKLKIVDATCPLVDKVHKEAVKFNKKGYKLILIGHDKHDETNGLKGEAPMQVIENEKQARKIKYLPDDNIAVLTQTTFLLKERDRIIKKLKIKYKKLHFPNSDDICFSTRSRQSAVSESACKFDVLLVAGSLTSNNAKKLVAGGRESGVKSHLISSPDDLNKMIIENAGRIGLTAAASTPEKNVQEIIKKIRNSHPEVTLKEIGLPEKYMKFPLPKINVT